MGLGFPGLARLRIGPAPPEKRPPLDDDEGGHERPERRTSADRQGSMRASALQGHGRRRVYHTPERSGQIKAEGKSAEEPVDAVLCIRPGGAAVNSQG